MPMKHWTKVGIMLTDWCNAQCSSCYLCCNPSRNNWISACDALKIWRELEEISPHGCKVHLTGGEPFGNYALLLEVVRRASDEGLGQTDKVETNGFWAADQQIVKKRIGELDAAGMKLFAVSCDPYHQQYIPIETLRLLVRTAEELITPHRVQVRWRDYLEMGTNTNTLEEPQRARLYLDWINKGRDRISGRAADMLSPYMEKHPPETFIGQDCREPLLKSGNIHVTPTGVVLPGVCSGLCLGNALQEHAGNIWARVYKEHNDRPILGTLVNQGPAGLLDMAQKAGFRPDPLGYAGKCHLCWDIKKYFAKNRMYANELCPVLAIV